MVTGVAAGAISGDSQLLTDTIRLGRIDMDFLAVPDAWPGAAAGLRLAAEQFASAELTAEAFRDRAVRILEELSATSPHAAELVAPRLNRVRHIAVGDLAAVAGPLAADVGQIAQTIVEIDQGHIGLMGL